MKHGGTQQIMFYGSYFFYWAGVLGIPFVLVDFIRALIYQPVGFDLGSSIMGTVLAVIGLVGMILITSRLRRDYRKG